MSDTMPREAADNIATVCVHFAYEAKFEEFYTWLLDGKPELMDIIDRDYVRKIIAMAHDTIATDCAPMS